MPPCLLAITFHSITLSIMKMKFLPAQVDAKVVLIAVPHANLSTAAKNISSLSDPMEFFNLTSLPLLLPEESYACTFSVSKCVGSSIRTIGVPEIKWCSYMGEHGIVTGNVVKLASNKSSQPHTQLSTDGQVQIDCITSPSTVVIGVDFEITLRITNNTIKQLPLQLICHDAVCSTFSSSYALMTEVVPTSSSESSSLGAGNVATEAQAGTQLFVTGLSKANIGILGPGLFVNIQIIVCAVGLGLQGLSGIAVRDISSLKEYPSKSLMNVMVICG